MIKKTKHLIISDKNIKINQPSNTVFQDTDWSIKILTDIQGLDFSYWNELIIYDYKTGKKFTITLSELCQTKNN